MEKVKNAKKVAGIIFLLLCNVFLIVSAVFYTAWYSKNIREQKETVARENFCNTVDTMRQISERYLDTELASAQGWAAYIEREHMTVDEAISYIAVLDGSTSYDAHIVDMDTFEAWSTMSIDGSNRIETYMFLYSKDYDSHAVEFLDRLREMFDGKKYVSGKYNIRESSQNVLSVGCPITLRQADGTDKEYLLLRVIPIDQMKKIWVFPVDYTSAEIGMIATNCDYVVPSDAMRSSNFVEFNRYYNFPDDYSGADRYLAQITEQKNGLLTLKDFSGRTCYWYYSRLENFYDLDIMGYIPVDALSDGGYSLSVVYVVAAIMFFLIVINGGYILSINHRLRRTAKAANQANNFKTQFLSTMSHDIRTPLNAVLGMTELAQSKIDNKEYVKECLSKIMISGNHLLTLINDILELSRVESGRIRINPAPFNVRTFISNLESILRSQATGHGLKFEVEVGDLPHENLVGDKLRLTQVYLNLLNNAVKYTKAGGSVKLSVSEEDLTADGKVNLICVVRDTGIGMSEEFQRTMYESFTRVSDARVDKITGTGLGLAIVKRMVDLMDGTIECDSTLDVGTTFTVRIPLDAATVAEVPEIHELTVDKNSDLRDLHILIAEDNDINWEIISIMLEDCGMICDRAENGRQCVDILTGTVPGTYDFVFMDVQMPLLNGLEATREIRAADREDLKTIPIAAMTADAFAEDVQGCIDAGMNAHISKPIEIDKVLSTIRLLLSRAKKNNN